MREEVRCKGWYDVVMYRCVRLQGYGEQGRGEVLTCRGGSEKGL